MSEQSDSPWTKNDSIINIIAFIVLFSFATFMIWVENWIVLIYYWIIWLLYFSIGSYFSYKPCVGVLGGLIYKISKKKKSEVTSKWKVFVFSFSLLGLAEIYPILYYLWRYVVEDLIFYEWILFIIYILLFFGFNIVHLAYGCRKCPTTSCNFNPASKKE